MIDDLLQAIAATPDDPSPTEAMSENIQATRSDPERWVRRAQLSAGMGEFRQARSDLECALAIAPGHLAARLELMRVDAQITRLQRELYQQDPWLAIQVHGPKDERDSRRRGFFETHLSLSVPSLHAVHAIASWVGTQTVLEVGSSKGLWARLLREAGVEMLATEHPSLCRSPHWMTVMPLDAENALRTLAADVLIFDGSRATVTKELIDSFGGMGIIIRGAVHQNLVEGLDQHWSCVHSLQIPSWTVDRDAIRFMVRRSR